VDFAIDHGWCKDRQDFDFGRCYGVFKPVWMDAGLPTLGPIPGGEYNAESLWWRHEALHRAVLCDYAARLSSYRAERDRLEQEFIESAAGCLGSSREERAHFTQKCFEISAEATDRWTNQARSLAIQNPTPILAQLAWRGFNHQAKYDF
jgi:hypothetical protein